jgi:hypothetical protein
MGRGPETTETILLAIGGSLLVLGLVLITGWVVGALVARRQYGVVMPLGLLLAAVALLLWWDPLVRLVVSFALLLIGYTWLFAWWRATQPRLDWAPSPQSRFARGGSRSSRNRAGVLAGGSRRAHRASTRRTVLEMRPADENALLNEDGSLPGR